MCGSARGSVEDERAESREARESETDARRGDARLLCVACNIPKAGETAELERLKHGASPPSTRVWGRILTDPRTAKQQREPYDRRGRGRPTPLPLTVRTLSPDPHPQSTLRGWPVRYLAVCETIREEATGAAARAGQRARAGPCRERAGSAAAWRVRTRSRARRTWPR